MKHTELIFVAVVTMLLGLGLALDVMFEPRPAREASARTGQHLASGQYCPAPSGDGVRAVMTTANVGDSPLGLRRTAVGGQEADPEQLVLDPQSLSSVDVGQFNLENATGLVDAFGGRAYSSLTVLDPGAGIASSLCTYQPSARWLFATGSTLRDDDHYLLVSNPFREEALVSVRVMGPETDENLPLISDEVVRAQSQRVFPMSENLEERESFGMEVTASRGRVVVSRFSSINTSVTRGISLEVGVRRPSERWFFANGRVPTEGEESLVVVNPSSREALLSVLFVTDAERIAPPELAEVAVPAGRQVTMAVSDFLPRGTEHGITLESLNDVAVVAERQIRGVVGSVRGFESVLGATQPAEEWILPVGSPEGGSSSLALINPGQASAEVSIRLITAEEQVTPGELSSIRLEAGRKLTVDVSGYLGGQPGTAVIESTEGLVADSTVVLEGTYNDFTTTQGLSP